MLERDVDLFVAFVKFETTKYLFCKRKMDSW